MGNRQTMMLIIISIILIVDLYLYFGLRGSLSYGTSKTLLWSYLGVSIFSILSLFMYQYMVGNSISALTMSGGALAFMGGVGLSIILIKLVAIVPFLVEDIYRVGKWIVSAISEESITPYPRRIQFIGNWTMIQAGAIFTILLYGIIFGKYDFRVHKTTIESPDLPKEFNGFKIVQISDTHLGTFDNLDRVKKGIDLINEQNPDIVVFTGDLVNFVSSEAEPYIPMFQSIEAKYGKFSILGNHDYADYASWKSQTERYNDVVRLKEIQEEMGFKLLLNDNSLIEKGDTSIRIIGVENWGEPPFAQYGDLAKAIKGTPTDEFSMLLSHDPSHWDAEVLKLDKKISLTMSGHTHAMQVGIRIGDWEWSPVSFKYKKWGGLYRDEDRYLYINRGFGSNGYPGRVGMWPEITVITLETK